MPALRKRQPHPEPWPVAYYTLAADHYNNPEFEEPDNTAGPGGIPMREWRAAQPYKAGDVVMTICGTGFRRAIIWHVIVSHDICGFRRPGYKIFPETSAGKWSRRWYYAYPGYIERGYQRSRGEGV